MLAILLGLKPGLHTDTYVRAVCNSCLFPTKPNKVNVNLVTTSPHASHVGLVLISAWCNDDTTIFLLFRPGWRIICTHAPHLIPKSL